MDIRKDLKNIELFGCLTDEQLDMMASGSRISSFPTGQNLITQGESGGDVLVITKGEADVFKRDDDSEGRKLATVGEGTILGEMSALTDKPAAADVVASTNCHAIRIPRAVFLDAVKKNPQTMSKLTTTVVKRFRTMMEGG